MVDMIEDQGWIVNTTVLKNPGNVGERPDAPTVRTAGNFILPSCPRWRRLATCADGV